MARIRLWLLSNATTTIWKQRLNITNFRCKVLGRLIHSLIIDFVYAHRAGWNGKIGSVWLNWKIFLCTVLFWAKKCSEITLWNVNLAKDLMVAETFPRTNYYLFSKNMQRSKKPLNSGKIIGYRKFRWSEVLIWIYQWNGPFLINNTKTCNIQIICNRIKGDILCFFPPNEENFVRHHQNVY